MLNHIKKIAYFFQNAITVILTLGALTSISVLSFTGVMVLSGGNIPLALAAAIFSCSIEIEVYRQNISKGLKNLRLLLPRGKKYLLIKELKLNAKKSPVYEENLSTLLFEYYDHRRLYEKEFKKQKGPEKKAFKKKLALMEKILSRKILNKEIYFDLEKIKTINRRLINIRLTAVLTLAAGLAIGFLTGINLWHACVILGVIGGISCPIIFLSTLAALATILIFYHTLAVFLTSDLLTEWRTKLKKIFIRNPGEKFFYYVARITGITALLMMVVGILGLMIISTGGSYYFDFLAGSKMLPIIIAKLFYYFLLPVNLLLQLVFNLKNSLATTQGLEKIIVSSYFYILRFRENFPLLIKNISLYFKEKWAKENLLQLLNPFRLVAGLIFFVFTPILFIGHLISIGVIGDRLPRVNPWFLTIVGVLEEFLEDFSYLAPTEHSDNHGNLILRILKIFFYPLILVGEIWNYGLSQLNGPNSSRRRMQFSEFSFYKLGGSMICLLRNIFLSSVTKNETSELLKLPLTWKKAESEFYQAERKDQLKNSWFKPSVAKAKIEILSHLSDYKNYDDIPEEKKELLARKRFSLFDKSHQETKSVIFAKHFFELN